MGTGVGDCVEHDDDEGGGSGDNLRTGLGKGVEDNEGKGEDNLGAGIGDGVEHNGDDGEGSEDMGFMRCDVRAVAGLYNGIYANTHSSAR